MASDSNSGNRMGVRRYTTPKRLRVLIILVLIFLTAQGLTGDSANLFAVFPMGGAANTALAFLKR
ncbi:MAG TPA: hypothetical protein VJN71_08990 [Nitrososphaerales archaeon]|nr:hypothetical protein [Nitrososphaerales archaeon]